MPRAYLEGYLGNFFTRNSVYQLVHSPRSFKNAGIIDVSGTPSEKKHMHQDVFRRVHRSGTSDDRYLNPDNGRVEELIVQSTDKIYRGPRNSTYKRTFIRNVAPKTLRVADWPMNHLDYGPQTQKPWALFLMIVKWPVTCCALFIIVCQLCIRILPSLLFFPRTTALIPCSQIVLPGVASTGEVVNGGCFAPFLYRYWGYCKIPRNALEASVKATKSPKASRKMPNNRLLEPRTLCFCTGQKLSLEDPNFPGLEMEMGKPKLVCLFSYQTIVFL